MELFTVDTAGDQDLLNSSHFESNDTEYYAKGFIVESTDDANRPDNQDEDDEDEDEYDYGGKCSFFSLSAPLSHLSRAVSPSLPPSRWSTNNRI